MEPSRKTIKIELFFIVIDKEKNITDKGYWNVLTDEYKRPPFIFLQESDFSIDKAIETEYNEWVSLNYEWAGSALASYSVSGDCLTLTFRLRMFKMDNLIKKGKLINFYDFLMIPGNEKYEQLI